MRTYHVGFLMSQALGHKNHEQRMRLEIEKTPDIRPEWMPIAPWIENRWRRLPVVKNNTTLLCGIQGVEQLRRQKGPFNALYCHTQEPAVLLGRYMERFPTILSLDATHINLRSLGDAYDRKPRFEPVERLKHLLIRTAFQRAAHFVAFSRWAKDSLVGDYGISEHKITVNAPGLDLGFWNISAAERGHLQEGATPRVLFIGGDFRRKGGEMLVQCAASMRAEGNIDIVTSAPVPAADGLSNVRVHRGLKAASPELLALYRRANIFTLPTLGDCSPWVILEAMAMRLPVIATRVGGIPEMVIDGETGLLIPPNSPEALLEAIRQLGKDPERRKRMGEAGRRRVERYFDSVRSYSTLVALIKSIAAKSSR